MIVSTNRFLHLSFAMNETVDVTQIENMFNVDPTIEWMRYTLNSWVLVTTADPLDIAKLVRSVRGMENANVFVCVFTEYGSYLPTSLWNWMAENTPGGLSKPTHTA